MTEPVKSTLQAPASAREPGRAMTEDQIKQWIDACNHEPAREVLRQYLRLTASTGLVLETTTEPEGKS